MNKPKPPGWEAIARAVANAGRMDSKPDGPTMEFPLRTVTCACGGRYTAGGSQFFVAAVIQEHAATERHQAWRVRQGIE